MILNRKMKKKKIKQIPQPRTHLIPQVQGLCLIFAKSLLYLRRLCAQKMSAKYLLSPLSAKIKELTVPYNKANIHTLSPWGSFLFSVFSLSCQAPGIYPHPSMSPNIVTILFNFLQFHSFGPKSFLLCSWIYSKKKKKKKLSFPPIVGNHVLSAPFSLWRVHFSSSSGPRCALPLGMENTVFKLISASSPFQLRHVFFKSLFLLCFSQMW